MLEKLKILALSLSVEEFDLKLMMEAHAIFCIFLGFGCTLLPHGWYTNTRRYEYDHDKHEFIRLYGALTLGIGWIVWKTRDITDGRLKRAISESLAICYLLQAVTMIRAQITNPNGHHALHWLIAIIFVCIGALYAYLRFVKKIKAFELPGAHES